MTSSKDLYSGRQHPEIPGYMESMKERLAAAVRNLGEDKKAGMERRLEKARDVEVHVEDDLDVA